MSENNKLEDWKKEQLGERIKEGQVFVFPTDTGYGLGCSIFRPESIRKIFEIKQRSDRKTVPVLCTFSQAKNLARFTSPEKEAADQFWPGALTLVLEAKNPEKLNKRLIRNNKIALRVPQIEPVVKLLATSVPIVGTSANLSGQPMPAKLDDLNPKLVKQVDFVLGEIQGDGRSSTVAEWSETESEWKIHREGPVKKAELPGDK